MHAWVAPAPPEARIPWRDLTFDPHLIQQEETRMLAESFAGLRAQRPEPEAEEEVVRASPVATVRPHP